jgi:predicted ArsR family transcriptional regulator
MTTVVGITVAEMAAELGIKPNAVYQRLYVAGIKPITHDALYAPEALEKIRNVPGKGRPRKEKPENSEK